MNYTSPSPANVGLNGNQTTWWIPARNLSTKAVDNVVVTVTVLPTTGLAPVTYLADVGSFNFATGKWNVGKLAAGAVKWLKIVTSVSDIGLAPWTVTSVITGDGIDTNNVNNTLVQTLTSVVCAPTAGAVNDANKCACIDVSENDQACSYGVSEWRLNPASVVNSTSYFWDTATGKGNFTHVDPSLNITGAYSLWCDPGTGFVEVSGPATFSINPTLESKNIFNHKAGTKTGAELTAAEVATLQAQPEYELLTEAQIRSYCWNTLLNGEGILVGGWAMDCNQKQDTRTFFECSATPCDDTPNPCPTCPQGQLPTDVTDIVNAYEDYTPQEGDAVFVQHPNAYAVYKWNGSQWLKWGCGCINLLPTAVTAVEVIGATTKTIIITNSDGTTVTNTFTDLDTDTTYILDGTTTPGTLLLINAVTNAIVSTVVLPAGGQTYLQVSDTCSLDLNISGDGSMVDPYIISGEVLTGAPVPLYVPGTVALGSSHTVPDVGVLFTETCGAGCTATYTVVGYPDAVFENVILTGIVLTYDIKADAPGGGTHFIEIQKICV
jgi:hypothetical protein